MAMIKDYIALVRLDKPIGILLLLWPTLWALWLAKGGMPDFDVLIIFLCGVLLMRSAGCVINDFADRNFDAHVARTRTRPLAMHAISPRAALVFFTILCSVAFLLVLNLNKLTIQLAFVGAGLAIVYPYLKRVTHLPQVGLGLAFAWGVPMAFAAQLNQLPHQSWLVFVAATIWPVIYDTLYAMVDREDDIKIGIKSTAILFANHARCIIGILQSIWLLLLITIGVVFKLHWPYFCSLIIVVILILQQHKWIKRAQRKMYFKAFLNNNWVGFVIFAGILLSDHL